MWWNPGPHLKRRMQAESGRYVEGVVQGTPAELAASQGRSTDLDQFKVVLRHKFGSIARAWRVGLDADESGMMDFREFCAAMKAIGYVGNLRTLWFNMDTDGSGTISLNELDPEAASAFEKFRALSTAKFGSVPEMWAKLLDQDRSGRVSLAEFVENAPKLGYEDPDEVEALFHLLLVRPGATFISLADISFLQCWEDTKRVKAQRNRLPVTWVNKDPALRGPAELPGSPVSQDYASAVAFDDATELDSFKQFLIRRYGSLANAFDMMDANDSGSLSLVEFVSVVLGVLEYCRPGEARRLFLMMNADPGGVVTPDELGIPVDEWANHMMLKRLRQRQARTSQVILAPLGSSPRMVQASKAHVSRVRLPKRREDIAFWTPLPDGWGKPPNFQPNLTLPAGWRTKR